MTSPAEPEPILLAKAKRNLPDQPVAQEDHNINNHRQLKSYIIHCQFLYHDLQ
jgi:hypothetical protein